MANVPRWLMSEWNNALLHAAIEVDFGRLVWRQLLAVQPVMIAASVGVRGCRYLMKR
jgi:hypothetical protein